MLNRKFSDRPFESQLLMAVVVIGIVRVFAGTLQDFLGAATIESLMIDLVVLLLFGAVAYFAFTKQALDRIHPLVGFFLLFLVCLLFIRSGGVEGAGEFNFFVLAVTLTLLFQGKWQKLLLMLMFVILLYLCYSIHVNNIVFDYLFVRNSRGYENFMFTLFMLAALIAYLQLLIEREGKKLRTHHEELQTKVSMLRKKNIELTHQQNLLNEMHERLQAEAKERRIYLEQKNKAIHLYIEQNTKRIQQPINNLKEAIIRVDDRYPKRYKEMLGLSLNELYAVSEGIKKTFISEDGFPSSSTQLYNNEGKS